MLQKSVQGERSYGRDVDYRGDKVRAAWMYIPSFRWGLVVKQDESEALALVIRQRPAVLGF